MGRPRAGFQRDNERVFLARSRDPVRPRVAKNGRDRLGGVSAAIGAGTPENVLGPRLHAAAAAAGQDVSGVRARFGKVSRTVHPLSRKSVSSARLPADRIRSPIPLEVQSPHIYFFGMRMCSVVAVIARVPPRSLQSPLYIYSHGLVGVHGCPVADTKNKV